MVDCPEGLKLVDSKGETVAFRSNWTDCVPNALNTVPFAAPIFSNMSNATTPDTNYVIETDSVLH